MATTGSKAPFMGSVSVGTSATGQDIWTLFSAVWSGLSHKCFFLEIQLDTTAGSASVYVGNSNVSATMCGVNLSANQAQLVYAFDSNLLVLDHIFLLSSSGTVQCNLTVVTR